MPFQLPTTEEKADYVEKQFDRIANRYDLANDAISFGMHRLWKARAISELCDGVNAENAKFLDVCCGTGDLALSIKHNPRAANVTGLDFSENMLSVARRRAQKAGEKNDAQSIEWIRGDAQALPFEDDTFNGAINSFGLRNLTDLQKGINEMARVVKPRARVINLDLGHSEVPLFAPLFAFFFRYLVPIIGEILQKDKSAYTYLPESLTTYPKPDGITKIFQQAGLVDIKHVPLAMGSVALHVGTKPERSKSTAQ
jgi:demethylmenaquinone methyltransferase/2-methoxy-6-polyprenyl-1,4-benzoquinol methylase